MEINDIPPLEDLSEFIYKKTKKSEAQARKDISFKNVNSDANINFKSSFGGMKKGFLSNQKQINIKNKEDIPYITSKKNNELQLKELNIEAIVNQNKNQLVELVEQDEDLCKQLFDEKYSKALQELTSNPQLAIQKYKNDKDLHMFLQKFSKILGSHFESLANKNDANLKANNDADSENLKEIKTVHFDKEVDMVLKNENLRNILLDSDIKEFINILKNNPDKAQRLLSNANFDFKRKIDQLIEAGLLRLEK